MKTLRLDLFRILVIVMGVTLALFCFSSQAATITYNSPTLSGNEWFGYSLATVGSNQVVIGEPLESWPSNFGAAYIYDFNGNIQATLAQPSPGANDYFGYAVTGIGNNVLVSAPYKQNGAFTYAGKAYLFDSSASWTIATTFEDPSPSNNEYFGWAVTAYDSSNVLISSPNSTNSGEVFKFDTATGTVQQTYTNPTSIVGDNFGNAIVSDGANVVVGAPKYDYGGQTDVGRVYIFNGTTGVLSQALEDPQRDIYWNSQFGTSVDMEGSYIVVGAPNGNNNNGQAYLYENVAGNWTLRYTFVIPPAASVTEFGSAVAISGNYVLIGGPDEFGRPGKAFLYDISDVFDVTLVETINTPGGAGDTFGSALTFVDGYDYLIGSYQYSGFTGRAYKMDGPAGPAPVPEPATLLLLSLSLFGFLPFKKKFF